jgi:hypothetical protein
LTENNEKEAAEWAEATVRRNLGPMRESAVFVGIMGGDMGKNALQCLQFGMALLMDKPIALMVIEGATVSEKLRTIADHIECVKADSSNLDEATQNIVKAMGRFMTPPPQETV